MECESRETSPLPNWLQLPKRSLPAPGIRALRLNGEIFELQALSGTPVLLHFWATFCAPCLQELPSLQRLGKQCGASQLKIITIVVDRGSPTRITALVERLGMDLPVVLDPNGEVRRRYEIGALPTTYFLDENLLIRGRAIGERDWQEEATQAALRNLLNTC